MASPILTHKYICQLSYRTKPTVATLSNLATTSSYKQFHQLGFTSLSQWNGLRQLRVSISHVSVKFELRRKCKRKGVFASLFGVGAPEALVIGVVALLVFGPKGLAEVARNLGKTLREFQPTIRELQDVSREFKSTLEREIGLDEVQNPAQKNYSSSTTKTNPIPSTSDSPVDSQIKAETTDSSIPESSSSEVGLKITDDQLESVSTQQEKQTEPVGESQSDLQTPFQVEEAAAVVPPPKKAKSDA